MADSEEVALLAYEPVVASGIGESQDEFLPTETAWFLSGDTSVPIAVHGPDDWARVEAEPVPHDLRRLTRWVLDQTGRTGPMDPVPDLPKKALPAIEVTDIEHTSSEISFRVSEPGVPVLVKTSYFPNWTVDGGEGPYRVTPNLMVVVPTSNQVTMRYARTPPDLFGIVLTILGLVGLVWLARSKPVEVPELAEGRMSRRLDALLTLPPSMPGSSGSPDAVTGAGPRGRPAVGRRPACAATPRTSADTEVRPRPGRRTRFGPGCRRSGRPRPVPAPLDDRADP